MIKSLSDVIKINTRFCRSININQDFGDAEILSGFICPQSSEIALLSIADNVSATGQSAFTWTGPYGAGKSSLAVFLSSLIGKDEKLRKIAQKIIKENVRKKIYSKLSVSSGWDILPIVGDVRDPKLLLQDAITQKLGRKRKNISN